MPWLHDAEAFLQRHRGRRIVLDEIHRLADPSTLHPKAALWLVAEDRQSWITRRHGAIEVVECGPTHLPELMD